MLIRCIIFCLLIAGAYSQEWKTWRPGNWERCRDGSSSPKTVVDTREHLDELRNKFSEHSIGAYIVPSGDFHLSEFVSHYDKRRQYISGFSGSAGTAVITRNAAALWTDGRYFLQAEGQLRCSWFLMRDGEEGVPSITEWLGEQVHTEKLTNVGASPYFFGNAEWKKYEMELSSHGITLVPIIPDLIDAIWIADRPDFPSSTINPLPLEFTGKAWQSKIADIEAGMEKRGVDVLVITGLDETAWMFNMRANDITGFVNDPFFYSLAIIERDSNITKLYIKDHERKLSVSPDDSVSQTPVIEHLNTQTDGLCDDMAGRCVEVKEYEFTVFMYDLQTLAQSRNVEKVWLSYHCNYAIYRIIPEAKILVDNTPAAMMKAMKNDIEVKGMKNAHIRDAAALIRFLAKLEEEVTAGNNWTEMSAKEELSRYRSMQELARGDSFSAISSVGPNAAINHYFVNNVTDRKITTDETYLLDSGGQYIDGTTDVTRSLLYRDPTDFEKECYTRVLMGQIELALAKWSKGLYGREIDAFARKPLWDVGLVYRHGTGHGIGAYLSVHEGPGRISNHHARFPWDVPLDKHMFFSDEPGYYQAGEFGIRLENIIFVKEVQTKYTFPGATMLGFETVTFVPYEPHLIDYDLLTKDEVAWLNQYHEECLEKVGPLLKDQKDERASRWLEKRTKPIQTSGSTATYICFPLILIVFLLAESELA